MLIMSSCQCMHLKSSVYDGSMDCIYRSQTRGSYAWFRATRRPVLLADGSGSTMRMNGTLVLRHCIRRRASRVRTPANFCSRRLTSR